MNSSLFKLNWKDFAKSILVFFLTTTVAGIAEIIYAGSLPTLAQLKIAAVAGATGSVTYLLKNFFTGPEDNYSSFFNINWRDIGKSAIMLFGTTVITAITAGLQAGSFPTWPAIKISLLTGVTAALGYIIKNVFTNSSGQALKKEST